MAICNQIESTSGETRDIGAASQNVSYSNQGLPNVNNVKDALDALKESQVKVVKLSQAAYDALPTKDSSTLYLIPIS